MGEDAAEVRAGIAVQVGYRIDEIRREDGLVLQFSRGEVVVYVLVVSTKAHTEGINHVLVTYVGAVLVSERDARRLQGRGRR